VLPLLQSAALVLCAIYATIPLFWFTLHPFTGHWRTHGRRSFRLILPLWFLYIAAAVAVLWPWRNHSLYATPYAYIPAALLILTGLQIYRAASRNFTHVQLSGLAELEPDRHAQRLVTTGIRSRVRHPIYLGHLCELLGWTIAFATTSLIALTIFAILTGALMLRLEDNELEQRFGSDYSAYRARVPAIVPRIF
jgi:protein-S-isoprenylcysteine O-methyltransferase Ste14